MELYAATRNISDLLSINKKYLIPRFQREYSWEKEHLDAFWDDILENIEISAEGNLINNEYFIGSLVLIGEDKTFIMQIVDGQQRLTTITILLSAIVHHMQTLDAEIAKATYTNYIEGSDENGHKYFKLDNETPKPFFQKAIQYYDKSNDSPQSKEEKKLSFAYEEFCKKLEKKNLFLLDIAKKLSGNDDEKHKTLLISVRNQILKYLKVIYITVKNWEEAGTIFETLNARGMNLSAVDLIKNDIFRALPSEHPDDDAKTAWKNIRIELSSRASNPNIDTFFRHFWLSNFSFTREGKIYRTFKKLQRQGEINPPQFLDKLTKSVKKYLILSSPVDSDWKLQEEKPVFDSLTALNIFDVTQVRTLLLALLDLKDSKLINITQLSEYLLVLEKFHFQFTAICSSRASGLEGKYSKISRTVREKKTKKEVKEYLDKELIDFLKEKLPSEQVFIEGLKNISYTNQKHKKLLQYIFRKQEKYLQPSSELEAILITLEHISSKSNNDHLMHSIGNLLPLSKELNEEADSKILVKKKPIYKKSSLMVINDFLKNDCDDSVINWDTNRIQSRTETLGKLFYSKIWAI